MPVRCRALPGCLCLDGRSTIDVRVRIFGHTKQFGTQANRPLLSPTHSLKSATAKKQSSSSSPSRSCPASTKSSNGTSPSLFPNTYPPPLLHSTTTNPLPQPNPRTRKKILGPARPLPRLAAHPAPAQTFEPQPHVANPKTAPQPHINSRARRDFGGRGVPRGDCGEADADEGGRE